MYVGQTTDPEKRWSKHKSVAKNIKSNPHKNYLYYAMNKDGIEHFSFEIIETCDYSVIEEREKYWIEKLNTLVPNGYNIRNGGPKLHGADNPFYGKHHTQETKEKISSKNKGRKASDEEKEMRRKINSGTNNPFYGKHHTQETKEKIIQTNKEKGNYQKLSERMKLNNPNDGSLSSKTVVQFDLEHNLLNIFNSAKEAGNYIKEQGLTTAKFPGNQISDVCRGIQNTAFGYYWAYFKPTLKLNLFEKTAGFIIEKRKKSNEN